MKKEKIYKDLSHLVERYIISVETKPLIEGVKTKYPSTLKKSKVLERIAEHLSNITYDEYILSKILSVERQINLLMEKDQMPDIEDILED